MDKGIIMKGIGGFYYVKTSNSRVIECKARGKFRKDKITPMVGDEVLIAIDKEEQGYIQEILPRRNRLIRPPVSNVDQGIIVFSISNPEPNLQLLDRFLVLGEKESLSLIICINKIDLTEESKINELFHRYENTKYPIIFTSVKEDTNIEILKKYLENNITVFAGPSGVGKSSLLNQINSYYKLQTGDVSKKIGRGKHTTRHVELFPFGENGFVVDTPGFSSLSMEDIEEQELMNYFPDFTPFLGECKFKTCIHINEPKCAIKNAVDLGKIDINRYNNYVYFVNEIKSKHKY